MSSWGGRRFGDITDARLGGGHIMPAAFPIVQLELFGVLLFLVGVVLREGMRLGLDGFELWWAWPRVAKRGVVL